MKPDLEKRKNPEWLNSELKKKEELQTVSADCSGQGVTVEALRERFDDLCHQFNHDDLDPVARVLKLAEIKRVREAINTIQNGGTHAK